MNTFRLVLLPPSAGDHVTDGGVTAVKQPFKKHLGGRDALVGTIRWPGYTQKQRESQGFEERKKVCKTSPPGGAAHLPPCWGFPLNAGASARAAASLVSFKGGKEEAALQLETSSDVNSLKM